MPNHIQNRLQVIGTPEQIAIVLKSISSEDRQMDFNKIVPMPESLGMESNSNVNMAVEITLKMPVNDNALIAMLEIGNREKAKSPLTFSDKDWDNFITGLNNVRKYGFVTWYKWSIANWGTKWNAYGQPDNRNTNDTVFFQTAWSAPIDLMVKLSAMFPDVSFQLDYADEDGGSNTGNVSLKKGEIVSKFQPKSGSKEGYEIYFELHPTAKDNYQLVGLNYEYIETV